MSTERLQKIIAAAGIASRRKAEEMITSGLVELNGKIVTELGTKADPDRDHIRVNGKLLHGAERHVYLLLNKPKDASPRRPKDGWSWICFMASELVCIQWVSSTMPARVCSCTSMAIWCISS